MTTSDFELLYGNDTKMDISSLSAAILFTAGPSQKVYSIEGLSNVVTLADLNLDLVDNTTDMDKPISTAVAAALAEVITTGEVLTFGNTTPFVPVLDYEPSTKLYVDGSVGGINHNSLNGYDSNEHIDWTEASVGTIDESNYSKYEHPSYTPRTPAVDSLELTGAWVISDLDFNIDTDTTGHVVNANAAMALRQLTLADLSYTGTVDADTYTSWSVTVDGGAEETVSSAEVLNLIGGNNVDISIVGKDVTFSAPALVVATDSVLGGVKSSSEILVDAQGVMTIAGLGGTGPTGVATLENGQVPVSQLPGAFGEFVEYADYATMIANGDGQGEDTTKTYITLDDDNTYKWTGSEYVNISGTGVDSIAGQSGIVLLTDIGLGNVTDTSDADKPVSTAQQTALDLKVDENADIVAGTGTKVTYDAKGLVTGSESATTADIAESADRNYLTDSALAIVGNTSGTNTGDNALNTNYTATGSDPAYELVTPLNDVVREDNVLGTLSPTNKIITEEDIGSLGGGDMLSTDYDVGIWDGVNSVDNARTVGNGFTVGISVPSDAIFDYAPATPGTDGTDGIDGLMTDADKFKLDTITSGAEANTVEINEVNTFTAAQIGSKQSLSYNLGNIIITFSDSNRFEVILQGDATITNIIDAVANQGGLIYVVQDATGSRTITWHSSMTLVNTDNSSKAPNDVQVYGYEVYSPTKIMITYIGTI